jgi:hypothetical protein
MSAFRGTSAALAVRWRGGSWPTADIGFVAEVQSAAAADGAILVKRLAPRQAGFTTPHTIIYVCYRTTNTGTLPSARTCDV